MHKLRIAALCSLLCAPLGAQDGYRLPPQAIVDAVLASPTPSVSTSPDKTRLVLSTRESMPSIAVQSRPILRLAGLRLDPGTHGRQLGARTTKFELVNIADGKSYPVHTPEHANLGSPMWTADGSKFAFTNTTDDAIELWVADAATGESAVVPGVTLNATLGSGASWMPDQTTLLCRLVAGPKSAPERARAPSGPIIQSTAGEKAPVRTFQDLLTDDHDAALFEHYTTAQLAIVDPARGVVKKIGEPAIFSSTSTSPDGNYLLAARVNRPFSYLVTSWSFPKTVYVIDLQTNKVTMTVAELPLADRVPIGGVLEGPRSARWIPTEDHSLVWAEALDGGDPKREASHRDRLLTRDVVADVASQEWLRLEHRYSSVSFGPKGELAMVSEYDRDTRIARTWRVNPQTPDVAPALWIERSTQDEYGNPGRPISTVLPNGKSVLLRHGDNIYMSGSGASPEGDRPFLDKWDVTTGAVERMFHCKPGVYESVSSLLAKDGSTLLVRRESQTDFPNYHVHTLADKSERTLTAFSDPSAAIIAQIQKELLVYDRDDGIQLSGTLYLPPGYEPGTKLPLLVWAYPREFNNAKNAGQVRGSEHRYTRLSQTSPLLLTLAGYAVINNAAMPIVGPVETANDTFIEQLVAGAKAAIDACVKRGVADRDRCAIAGHSYGAFMTANLLAHSDLFRAGVARSGAYNRTLTPFGFQNERRTYWEAPEVYFAMSPFMHAQKIDEPLLMIHGVMDNNSGTFPIQSERLFHAIKGNGGVARLVMLPHESHGYRAQESVLHCLAETVDWLDTHVKGHVAEGGGGGR